MGTVYRAGRYGERILSEEYIDEATSTQVQPPPEVSVNGYGYQIWTGENFFLFNGMFGQNLICFRDTGVIIVSNGGTGEMFQSSPFYTKTISTFSDHGSPVFSEGDADGALYLENVLKSIAFVPPAPICSGRTAKRGFFARLLGRNGETPEVIDPLLKYSGTELIADDMHAASAGLLPMMLQATQNTYTGGLTSVSFGEKDGALTVTFDESGEKHVFKAGYYRPETSDLDFSGEKYLVTAAGRTAYNEDGDEVLTIDVDFTETPCSKRLKFIFRDCGAVLAMTEKPGGDFILSSVLGVKEAFSGSILLRPILGRIEDDYLDFKTERAFSPKINMKYSDGQNRK